MMKRLLLVPALCLLAATALAGCGTQLTAQDIVTHMQATAASTDSAHLVVTVAGQVNGQEANAMLGGTHIADVNGTITAELWYRKPNLLRVQVLSSSYPALVVAMLFHDGTHIWAYDPHTKIAYKMDTDALRQAAGKANIPANLQDMLANPDLENAINQLLALTDYTLAGPEKVGNYTTYRLDLLPKAGSPAAQVLPDARATLWVDQTTWVPVKATLTAKQGHGQMDMSTLELNKTLPDSTFQFSLPNGGHVLDLTNTVPHTVNLVQARQIMQAGGYHLLEPAYVPAGATLVQVMGSRGLTGNSPQVTLNYSGGSSTPTFWISELSGSTDLKAAGTMSGAGDAQFGAGQAVTVRGVQGHYASHTEKTSGAEVGLLWWKDSSGLTMAVSGQLSQAELLKIAESMK